MPVPGWITTKLLGFVSGGLAIALALAVAFGWVQSGRLNVATQRIKDLGGQIVLLEQRVNSDAGLIATRDRLIAAQNQAVLAMQQAADADRKAYEARIAAANKLAQVQEARAKDIMSRHVDTQDELERSRAALALIQEMVGAEPKETPHVRP